MRITILGLALGMALAPFGAAQQTAPQLATQEAPQVAPDDIFYNGKVVTVDAAFRIAQAFAVEGDEVVAVGSDAEVRKLAGPRTRLSDLRGRTVVPGLMDNHNHAYIGGMVEHRGVNLKGVKSLPEMFERIRAAIAVARPGEAIVTTTGWTEEGLVEHRAPTRAELDLVAPDRPLVVMRARGDAYLNSAALRAAGITRATGKIAGVEVLKDASGEPTGQIGPPGMVNAVLPRILPPPAPALQEQVLVAMQERLLAMGITGIREVEMSAEAMRAYQELRRNGKLKLRVSMGIDVNVGDWDRMDEILRPWGVGPGFGDHWLRLDAVSEFAVDTGGATAWTREPHLEPPDGGSGSMRITPEQVRAAMLAVNRQGWRPAVHISGDRALDAVLDAFEAAHAERSILGRRWVVEHIPMVHPDQMERMARLGVLVSAQIHPYRGYEGNVRTYGRERADRIVPLRELLEKKLVVSTGSDFPGQSSAPDPFLNFYFYVTRKTERGAVAGAEQKISREDALRVATIHNAYMTFEENVKGSIEPGKLADFVILSADIMTVPETELLTIRPLATYVGGRKMYAAAGGGF